MKIGIITDIHSNVQALKSVFNEFDKRGVDRIICCGDIIGIGINPEEAVQELMKRKHMLTAVVGNHEQYLLKGLPKKIHNGKITLSTIEIDNHNWNHIKLSQESKEFLKELDKSKIIEIEGKMIYITHYPQESNGTFKKHIKNPNISENKELFKEIDADIFLYGHTHTYSVNNENDKWYINPGSLGCPMTKNNIAKAGILEINDGEVMFNQVNVEYNVEEVIEEINKLKFPYYKSILKIFYGV